MPSANDLRLRRLASQGPLFRLLRPADFRGVEAEMILSGNGGRSLSATKLELRSGTYLLYLPPRGSLPLPRIDRGMQLPQLGRERGRQLAASLHDLRARLLSPVLGRLSLDTVYVSAQKLLFPVLPLRAGACPWPGSGPAFWQAWCAFYHLAAELGTQAEYLEQEGRFAELDALLQDRPLRPARSQSSASGLGLLSVPASLTEILEWPSGRKKRGRKALLVDRELLIGRDPVYADLVFRDARLERRQARLSRERGVWYIEDLSGRGSSLLDGLRLRQGEPCILPPCCHLRLGGRLFLFEEKTEKTGSYLVPKRRSPASPRPGTI